MPFRNTDLHAQVIFLNSSFVACPCFHLLIVVLGLQPVTRSCASTAPLPNTCSHGPPHRTLHRTGCVWGGETCPTRVPIADLSVHPHQPSFFCSPPVPGPSQAPTMSHTRVHRQPCSGVCQGLGKKRGWAGLALPPTQAPRPASGRRWPQSKTTHKLG